MNLEHVAYVAGLVDGEGYIGTTKYRATKNGRAYRRPQVHVTNTDRRCLDFIVLTFGYGKIYKNSRVLATKKNGTPCKQGYRYQVSHQNARQFLRTLLPFLVIKRESALNVLGGGA